MKCSRLPGNWRKSWVVWVRTSVDFWKHDFATNDPARAIEASFDRDLETLVLPPGERPLMPKAYCHRGTN